MNARQIILDRELADFIQKLVILDASVVELSEIIDQLDSLRIATRIDSEKRFLEDEQDKALSLSTL